MHPKEAAEKFRNTERVPIGMKASSSGYCGRVDHPDQVARYVARSALREAGIPELLAAEPGQRHTR